jgi:hypothetical protein
MQGDSKLSLKVYRIHFRHLVTDSFLLLTGATCAVGGNRLNLPQVSAEVALSSAAQSELDPVLEKGASDAEYTLPLRATQLLVESLPPHMRAGCGAMVPNFGQTSKQSGEWTVRLLRGEGNKGERSAVLAFRCTVHVPEVTYYDERPAVLLPRKQEAVLKLLPVADDCTDCTDLYHLQFSQRFEAETGYLAELDVWHSTENPCCDGLQSQSGTLLFMIAVPEGAGVLALDRETNDHSQGDEVSDSVCKSVVSYERDTAGRLQGVSARIRCTEDGKKVPDQTRRFHWKPVKKRFEEDQSASKK